MGEIRLEQASFGGGAPSRPARSQASSAETPTAKRQGDAQISFGESGNEAAGVEIPESLTSEEWIETQEAPHGSDQGGSDQGGSDQGGSGQGGSDQGGSGQGGSDQGGSHSDEEHDQSFEGLIALGGRAETGPVQTDPDQAEAIWISSTPATLSVLAGPEDRPIRQSKRAKRDRFIAANCYQNKLKDDKQRYLDRLKRLLFISILAFIGMIVWWFGFYDGGSLVVTGANTGANTGAELVTRDHQKNRRDK